MQGKGKCFDTFGVYVECAGNSVPSVLTLKKFIDISKKLGFNCLYIGTADTYTIESEKYFGYNRGRYSVNELSEVSKYGESQGIEIIPSIQTLAHLNFLGQYKDYKEIIDFDNILLCEEDKTYDLIDKMFEAISKCYISRKINIGMDEAFMLGLGKFREKNGIKPRLEIMLNHLKKVLNIAQKYGFTCQMWSDMFYRLCNNGDYDINVNDSEIVSLIPKNVELIYWSYGNVGYERLSKAIVSHKKITQNLTFAGGLWKWIGFAPDNEYSIKAIKNAINVCEENEVKNFVITLWSDNGGECSLFSILPSLFVSSKLALNKNFVMNNEAKEEFFNLFKVNYDDFMLLDKLNKPIEKNYEEINNKSYFHLYNDVLLGTFDSLVTENIGEHYLELSNKLNEISAGEFTYIFKTLSSLSKVLSIKAELGKTLRKFYKVNDKISLKIIAETKIPKLIKFIDELISNFTVLWEKENKSYGFEVQCLRLGGLKERLNYVLKKVKSFIESGAIIEEFEGEQLPFNYNFWLNKATDDNLLFCSYSQMALNSYN